MSSIFKDVPITCSVRNSSTVSKLSLTCTKSFKQIENFNLYQTYCVNKALEKKTHPEASVKPTQPLLLHICNKGYKLINRNVVTCK